MVEALNLHGDSKTNKRRELDFYPTPPDVTRALMEYLYSKEIIVYPITIWEPACGDGAMVEVLKEYGRVVYCSDIRETGYGKGGVDYLNSPCTLPVDAIITNPPFNQSAAFIEKAVKDAPIVAMLLKSQYWHAAKRTELFEKHPPAYVLALNWRPDFMNKERGGAPIMECLWTVWIEGLYDTKYRILQRPEGENLKLKNRYPDGFSQNASINRAVGD